MDDDETMQWMRMQLPRIERVLVDVAMGGRCAKSRRAVLVVDPANGEIDGVGVNAQPPPFACDGSEACRVACGKLCVHAEVAALRDAGGLARGGHLFHLKVVDGKPVPSGPPSCWQCSREILAAGISAVWLLHEGGWTPYSAEDFHAQTLAHEGLPVLRGPG